MADSRFLMLARSGLVLGVWGRFWAGWLLDPSGPGASPGLEEVERSRKDSLASTPTSSTASPASRPTSPSLPSTRLPSLLSSSTNL